MRIFLAFYAPSDATVDRLHADPALAWQVMDSQRPDSASPAS